MSRSGTFRSIALRGNPLLAGSLVFALVVGLSGCVVGRGSAQTPVRPTVINVAMDESHFTLDRERVESGRLVFKVRNEGDREHNMILIGLPDDVSGVDDWLERDVLGVVPISRVRGRAPGEDDVLAADLAPGRYALVCSVREESEILRHHHKGMTADLTVVDASGRLPAGSDGDS